MIRSSLILILTVSILFADFIRDDTTEIVTDNVTGLQWQDDAKSADNALIWTEALDLCESLSLGGRSDWRLPNINELRSIVDFRHIDPATDPIFRNSASTPYWSSTSDDDIYAYHAWFIDFYDGSRMGSHDPSGSLAEISKYDGAHVRCVRGGL